MEILKAKIKQALDEAKALERSRGNSLVITKLEEALLWASAQEVLNEG